MTQRGIRTVRRANVAGICNRERNVAGLMPHPERAVEGVLDSRGWHCDFPLDGGSAGGRGKGDSVKRTEDSID